MHLSFKKQLAGPDWRIDVSAGEFRRPLLRVEPCRTPRARFVEELRVYRELGQHDPVIQLADGYLMKPVSLKHLVGAVLRCQAEERL